MSSYYVRICMGFSFVQEKLELGTDPLHVVFAQLPSSCSAELISDRYTFGVVRMKAVTRTECAGIVDAAWKRSFPDDPDVMRTLITPDDGTDTAELMRTIYSVYYGAEAYQELVTDLTASIPLLKERKAMKAFRMQNYLFAIDSGCGFTTLLSSFGDYLRRMGVYGDESDKRTNYVEFIVNKENDGERAGMSEIIESLMCSDEENNKNVVGLDISYFLEGDKTDELRRFAHRLYFLQNKYVFVFRVPFLEKKSLDGIAAALSDIMLLRVVQIPPLHDYVLYEYLSDESYRLGFRIDNTTREPYLKKIRQEKKDGRFYGFKTAEKVLQEMVLKKTLKDANDEYDGKIVDRVIISSDDLPGFGDGGKAEKSGYDALNELIGMEKIAQRVREIVAQVKLSLTNEKLDRPCIHMRFVGSPGTGKTTVARIIGQIFREEGILRKGAFLEYSARSLCAEYVGQTAVKTASICRDAYGSVLFLDEAYALYDDMHQTNDYGKEALTTLISEMENHRDDMLVIMAGYTDDMEMLMKGNAGLRSRMPYMISFPNYTKEQLFEIFMLMVKKHFSYAPELETEAKRFFTSLPDSFVDSREFANARFVRNLYERTWSKGSLRCSLNGLNTLQLLREDFLAASSEEEFSEKLQRQIRVGF